LRHTPRATYATGNDAPVKIAEGWPSTRFARRSNQSQQQPDDLQGNWISIGVALRPQVQNKAEKID
jgi:hypothetical protein